MTKLVQQVTVYCCDCQAPFRIKYSEWYRRPLSKRRCNSCILANRAKKTSKI